MALASVEAQTNPNAIEKDKDIEAVRGIIQKVKIELLNICETPSADDIRKATTTIIKSFGSVRKLRQSSYEAVDSAIREALATLFPKGSIGMLPRSS